MSAVGNGRVGMYLPACGGLHRKVYRAAQRGIGDCQPLGYLCVRPDGRRCPGTDKHVDHLVALRFGNIQAPGEDRHGRLILRRRLLHADVHLCNIDVHGY